MDYLKNLPLDDLHLEIDVINQAAEQEKMLIDAEQR